MRRSQSPSHGWEYECSLGPKDAVIRVQGSAHSARRRVFCTTTSTSKSSGAKSSAWSAAPVPANPFCYGRSSACSSQPSGTIEVLGQNMAGLDGDALIRMQIRWGVLFQDGALFGDQTVAENVQIPLREHTDLPQKLMDEIASVKLSMVGIATGRCETIPSRAVGRHAQARRSGASSGAGSRTFVSRRTHSGPRSDFSGAVRHSCAGSAAKPASYGIHGDARHRYACALRPTALRYWSIARLPLAPSPPYATTQSLDPRVLRWCAGSRGTHGLGS